MAFAIVTDTSANLPEEYVQKHHITVIPFSYFIDGEAHTCIDSTGFDGLKYYESMRQGMDVTTSQITPQIYIDYFEPLLEGGSDILYIGMSSGISGSFASALAAAAEMRKKYKARAIRLVDTLGASLGEGLLVMKAVSLQEKGLHLQDVTDLLKNYRRRICQVFTVEDLKYLKKSGRLSNVAAVIGTVLNIKPLLKGNEEGKIVAYGKIRGKRRAVEALAKRYEELAVKPERQTVCIAHADCPKDAAYLEELIHRNRPPKEVMTVCYEPVTGSHVGPGTLALFFESDERVRSR